jgi:hypothetical protein
VGKNRNKKWNKKSAAKKIIELLILLYKFFLFCKLYKMDNKIPAINE